MLLPMYSYALSFLRLRILGHFEHLNAESVAACLLMRRCHSYLKHFCISAWLVGSYGIDKVFLTFLEQDNILDKMDARIYKIRFLQINCWIFKSDRIFKSNTVYYSCKSRSSEQSNAICRHRIVYWIPIMSAEGPHLATSYISIDPFTVLRTIPAATRAPSFRDTEAWNWNV